jgi:hypothetical protein
MMNANAQETLLLLFHLSSGGAPTRSALQAHLGSSTQNLDARLATLRSLGLVQDDRLRLTMSGLVAACGMRAAGTKRVTKPRRRCVAGISELPSGLGARLGRIAAEARVSTENNEHEKDALLSVA